MTDHDLQRSLDSSEAGTESAPSSSRRRPPYRWVAMGVVLFGTFMVVLDTTIINLGLPSLQRDFQTLHGVEWVVTAYLIAVGATQLTSGWAGDRFGRRRCFIVALALFTVASALCAVAPSLEILVLFRILQGVGGGLLMPIAMAMVYELFEPSERGRALGYFGIAVMAAPAIGPVLGGTVVSSIGWRWLFLINVPIGLIGTPIAIRLLRDTGYREARPFDSTGFVTAGLGLVAILIGLQQGGAWGWTSLRIVLLLLGGVALIVLFTLHSLGHPAPLVDMRLFANPVFTLAMLASSLLTIGQYCRLIYIPLELGTTRGIDELKIGFVMLPAALGVAATMPLGGRLTDRIGARLPVALGAAVLFVSYLPLANLGPDTQLRWISLALLGGGLGAGLAVMSPNIVAMNAVPAPSVGQASGLSQVTRQVSAGFGTAILASVYTSALPVASGDDPAAVSPADAIHAYNTVFLAALVCIGLAVVTALFLPGQRRAKELQREREVERDELVKSGAFVADSSAPTLEH
ncbi:MAG: DHA2 family efflux MFS transporter permease subunit [Ilumatobacteraceae bacterium]